MCKIIDQQIAANFKRGQYLTVYLKNGRRINGRFKVWKKYDDTTKFADIAETSAHFLLYDNKIGDYAVIVKNNISKIRANGVTIINNNI